ncbi:MAG: tRNA glutamyl-Q(34) synthetase GluQRS [Sutterellaceae bacterium]|nr:tRNA glutamyl-Q(34) synthetase GluQRS [Sutterellaceae bacterium]
MSAYVGRFAPSPTGPLHFGSLVCAMATYLDARAHAGTWLVRIEDIDPPRDVPGADVDILNTLAGFGMQSDKDVVWQSDRDALYEAALKTLQQNRAVYGCACSRSEIQAQNKRLGLPAGVYPGTCRAGTGDRAVRAWRFLTTDTPVEFTDRIQGRYCQNVEKEVGDFVVKRADGLWAYQLAVVVDDALQGITHVVRGADLLDNTPRQILLQKALGYPTPVYMHIPIVTDANGQKLSKQTKAKAVSCADPLPVLETAFEFLGFQKISAKSLDAFWMSAVNCWAERFVSK